MTENSALSFTRTEDGREIQFLAQPVGADLVVIVSGGDTAHIGATALAQPRPSLAEPNRTSASTSVLCVLGHKEELLAHHIAQTISAACNCVVSVSCGIHIDNATAAQIQTIQRLVEELLQTFIRQRSIHG
ncbi:MAG: hypothetical protein ACK5PS_02230 [Desulfopila sp.]